MGEGCHHQSPYWHTNIEEIKTETGAIWAHRITKRVSAGYEPTTAVIIAFETGLPHTVNTDFTRHGVTVYIPTPTRCNKCQKYGHKLDQCTRKEPWLLLLRRMNVVATL